MIYPDYLTSGLNDFRCPRLGCNYSNSLEYSKWTCENKMQQYIVIPKRHNIFAKHPESSPKRHHFYKSQSPFKSGWWFGTFFIFPYIGNSNPNWLLYFSEGLKPPTRNGYYKVMSNIPKMGQLPTPVNPHSNRFLILRHLSFWGWDDENSAALARAKAGSACSSQPPLDSDWVVEDGRLVIPKTRKTIGKP